MPPCGPERSFPSQSGQRLVLAMRSCSQMVRWSPSLEVRSIAVGRSQFLRNLSILDYLSSIGIEVGTTACAERWGNLGSRLAFNFVELTTNPSFFQGSRDKKTAGSIRGTLPFAPATRALAAAKSAMNALVYPKIRIHRMLKIRIIEKMMIL